MNTGRRRSRGTGGSLNPNHTTFDRRLVRYFRPLFEADIMCSSRISESLCANTSTKYVLHSCGSSADGGTIRSQLSGALHLVHWPQRRLFHGFADTPAELTQGPSYPYFCGGGYRLAWHKVYPEKSDRKSVFGCDRTSTNTSYSYTLFLLHSADS